ncbi:methylmalonyl-CoA mutase subunit beta [Streptomyces sp. NPDC093085]|uniref:methylmalonyl-CoA mutase subunit beta n=1 Tax=Streptomyces sp. NPDC093085 TaxID=3155068 RepID=UPI00342D8AD1
MTLLNDDGLSLAAEFPDATRGQWQELVSGVLRKAGRDLTGAAAEDALATRLQDGVITRPLYTARDAPGAAGTGGFPGFAPFTRGATPEGAAASGWDVRQRHARPDPAPANEAVLADLEHGVTSLWLAVGDRGVPVAALPAVLDGVHLDLAPVVLDAGDAFPAAARALLALHEERGVAPADVRAILGADPVGQLARTGRETADGTAEAAELAALCDRRHPGVRALVVDALPYHEAGASDAQELGCSLATGVGWLRELTARGLTVEAACRQLEFRYAATADQFLTIAKLRAARRLWARVAEACGARPAARAQRQHAVTSPVMMTRRDPWVNMLRTTVAALAAGTGGADAVTVLPFDDALGLPDAFARRIARNTSTILLEESHLGRVIDPAGGSWYVESLTDALAHAAWAWFQELERAGGQRAALRSGLVAERLAATWAERSARLAERREPITGVSEFPQLAQAPVVRDAPPEPAGPAGPPGGLPVVRRDEAYERLRARSDAHLAATGRRPRVLLATLGPAAAYTARAAFAAGLFEAGGIEAVQAPVTAGPASGAERGTESGAESAAEALARSGAAIACLCSSDALYAEGAAPVAAALKAAGALRVYLAGRPGESRERHVRAGVDAFITTGGDAVALLTSALDLMGVAP